MLLFPAPFLASKDAKLPFPSFLENITTHLKATPPRRKQGIHREKGRRRERERRELSQQREKFADHHSSMANQYDQLAEEEYIDMDISSATFLCYNKSSPPHSREFEFQMSAPLERETITSPADELFYKGKLLPLHLPPRLQMVQKLLHNSNIPTHGKKSESFDESVITTITNTNTNTATTTPFESCNVSPATSCYVSGELHAEDYYFECSTELVHSHPKKSWSKKLKFMRQSSLGLKLKASKAFLKSLFTKSGCSDEKNAVPKVKECSNGHLKSGRKNPFGQIQRERMVVAHNNATSIDEEKMKEEEHCSHRRSFSGAIKWHFSTKSSSASSSCSSSSSSSFSSMNSNGLFGPPMLKRSSSVNSDMENSIQGAIAYCKKSQLLVSARKSVSDVGFCSLTATRIAADCEKQEKPGLCRG
ncbi:putative membrane-associated kinase regulator 4 [Cocos nucifera]|uniref:Putative membrane-associated kinase regulator 4 n=1 Tax=Cocos nucifera TaxID=13894 RepID=A0A8K0IRU7_COCNU|nr:putative membrane-associated kinase regulator 4 [Cocos nucifera]